MKADIHPDYHEITVVLTDGKEYKTRSTYQKAGAVLKLDIDSLSHPAWSGGAARVIEKGQLSKFENRYGNLFGAGGTTAKKEEEKK